jgi:hypothetical protein
VAEAKQLAALQALLGLTAGPEAGLLGSSWLIVLRCVSALDALKVSGSLLTASVSSLIVGVMLISLAKAKQLAALQALLGSAAEPEAGFLGSSWLIVLRCVSALDALKVSRASTFADEQQSVWLGCCDMLWQLGLYSSYLV